MMRKPVLHGAVLFFFTGLLLDAAPGVIRMEVGPVGDTLGEQRVFLLLCDNKPGPPPGTLAQVSALMAQVDGWYREVSFGKTWLRTTDIYGWYTLPDGVEDDAALVQFALDQGVDFHLCDRLIFAYTAGQLSGGSADFGKHDYQIGSGPDSYWIRTSVMKLWRFSLNFGGVIAHEMGHNQGFCHASHRSSVTGEDTEYGDNNDQMGSGNWHHFNGYYKRWAGWLDPENMTTVAASGTYAILPLEAAAESPQVLRIPLRDGNDLYVEYRQRIGSDADLSYNATEGALLKEGGVIAGYPRALSIDMTPETPHDESRDSALMPGRSYTDWANGICVTALPPTSGPSSLQLPVQVNFLADFPDNHPPVVNDVTVDYQMLEQGAYRVTFHADVSDPDGDELSYFWSLDMDWGNGAFYEPGKFADGPSVSCTYPGAVPRKVLLMVSDRKGGIQWRPLDLFGHDPYRRVPSRYPTIQAAVDAAWPGDTVQVSDGTYTGLGNRDVDLRGKWITVKSENGSAAAVIDCQGTPSDPHRAFVFNAFGTAFAVLEGLTLRGGYHDFGGAVYCSGFASPTIRSNLFIGNASRYSGGAIHFTSGIGSEPPRILGNTFLDNAAGDMGGGIYSGAAALIQQNVLSGNAASFNGGAVACTGPARILQNTLTGNQANVGGGIYFNTTTGGGIERNLILRNTAPFGGGGISCQGSGQQVSDNLIAGNTSPKGGAISLWTNTPSAAFSFVNNTLVGNVASEAGGGIYAEGYGSGDSFAVADCILWNPASPSEIFIRPAGPMDATVRYSDVRGGWTGAGEGNIDADPLFVDPAEDDYHLMPYSSCIDAADGSAASPADQEGNPRFDDPDVANTGTGVPDYADIGAFERQTGSGEKSPPGLRFDLLRGRPVSGDASSLLPQDGAFLVTASEKGETQARLRLPAVPSSSPTLEIVLKADIPFTWIEASVLDPKTGRCKSLGIWSVHTKGTALRIGGLPAAGPGKGTVDVILRHCHPDGTPFKGSLDSVRLH